MIKKFVSKKQNCVSQLVVNGFLVCYNKIDIFEQSSVATLCLIYKKFERKEVCLLIKGVKVYFDGKQWAVKNPEPVVQKSEVTPVVAVPADDKKGTQIDTLKNG